MYNIKKSGSEFMETTSVHLMQKCVYFNYMWQSLVEIEHYSVAHYRVQSAVVQNFR